MSKSSFVKYTHHYPLRAEVNQCPPAAIIRAYCTLYKQELRWSRIGDGCSGMLAGIWLAVSFGEPSMWQCNMSAHMGPRTELLQVQQARALLVVQGAAWCVLRSSWPAADMCRTQHCSTVFLGCAGGRAAENNPVHIYSIPIDRP